MRVQLLNDQVVKTYIVIFEADDQTEVVHGLTAFARRYSIAAAQITAIGMFSQTTIGYFDRAQKQYLPIAIDENAEVLSLVGDFSFDTEKNEPKLHLHAVLGLRDGSTRGGHLLSAHVGPTLEVMVNVFPATLRRVLNQDVGLALINLDDNAETILLAYRLLRRASGNPTRLLQVWANQRRQARDFDRLSHCSDKQRGAVG